MTLSEIARALHCPVIVLRHLQRRFDLPAFEGASYPPAYLALLRKLVHLRSLNVSEDLLAELWKTEKHLLQLLHFDNADSPTGFLDSCARPPHPRRLLLSSRDMGPEFTARAVQPRLDFDPSAAGLFSHREIGEDVIRVRDRYHQLAREVRAAAEAEAPNLRASLRWRSSLRSAANPPPPAG